MLATSRRKPGIVRWASVTASSHSQKRFSQRDDSRQLGVRCRRYVEQEHSLKKAADQWAATLGLTALPVTTARHEAEDSRSALHGAGVNGE